MAITISGERYYQLFYNNQSYNNWKHNQEVFTEQNFGNATAIDESMNIENSTIIDQELKDKLAALSDALCKEREDARNNGSDPFMHPDSEGGTIKWNEYGYLDNGSGVIVGGTGIEGVNARFDSVSGGYTISINLRHGYFNSIESIIGNYDRISKSIDELEAKIKDSADAGIFGKYHADLIPLLREELDAELERSMNDVLDKQLRAVSILGIEADTEEMSSEFSREFIQARAEASETASVQDIAKQVLMSLFEKFGIPASMLSMSSPLGAVFDAMNNSKGDSRSMEEFMTDFVSRPKEFGPVPLSDLSKELNYVSTLPSWQFTEKDLEMMRSDKPVSTLDFGKLNFEA